MSKILKEVIDLIVISEILGKFDLSKFKSLAANDARRPEPQGSVHDLPEEYQQHPEILYAKQHLPEIGQGSSRITFALSGDKVLKIALNNAGIGQNEEEVQVYTRLHKNDLVTKIFDFDPKYKWLVSELVKPFTSSAELENILGITLQSFLDIVYYAIRANSFRFESWKKEKIQKLQNNIERADKNIEWYGQSLDVEALENSKKIKSQYLRELEMLKQSNKDQVIDKLIQNITNLVSTNNLVPGDLDIHDHYGRTVDGRIKLLDYGASRDVIRKYYK